MKKIDCTLDSLSFSFYSPEDIRKLAVKEITSLISIEPTLGKGAANGLYDANLGSLSDREPCRNCNLSYYECNGHYGRIEFHKPIYHPILFEYLVKLIKGTCFYCHKLSYNQGLFECIYDLAKKDDIKSVKRFNDLEEFRSLSSTEKEKLAVKLMSQQHRRICSFCSKKPLVFTKSRKSEILVHISAKTHQGKDEPESKRMKLDDSSDLKKFQSNFTEMELYGKFTEVDSSISPEILREHLRMLWLKEHENLQLIFPILKTCQFQHPTDIFFMENMLINPPMNRLPAIMNGDQMTESPETTNMCQVVRAAAALREVLKKSDSITDDQRYQNVREGILELQKRTNVCFDANIHRELGAQPGLRQKIDKKEGLFRQNIMGKRVNFACRSVISPDPNIGLDEIGVPVIFLSKLMFPQPMNPLNRDFLRQCVLNGPDIYPGAISYQIDHAAPVAIHRNRESIAELLELSLQQKRAVIVHRHAITGDMLIMNRQPTLHRPSMQAHVIRAISDPRAKTLRMHYSNCKAYNADFDGDEMNGHYLQSIPAQAEARLIMGVCHQHSTPKDGSPLAGLIQDHVIAGTRLCMRNCFVERSEYIDLVAYGLQNNGKERWRLLPPAIVHPRRLWTGKQVISTIIINSIPVGVPMPNIECKEPKKNTLWNISKETIDLGLSDVELIIVEGYVCTGIFDKAHIGPSQKGLCTDLRELYGSVSALHTLTCLSRVFNRYLIYTGFSTGLRDGQLNRDGNQIRENIIGKIRSVGLTSIAASFKISRDKINLKNIAELMEKAQFDRSDEFRGKMAEIDTNFKLLSLPFINQLGTACKRNLHIAFPHNNLSFMSQTGAKGGESNVTKIAIALGAIEIEGRRCPLTIGGRTLPSFHRYEFNPAARGFCMSRFSSGLTAQELFFESMAGRDGLVDTAVKTSSSGYLQRCLVKHLEDVTVFHDCTVRDNDHNIVQFRYGYDGLDVILAVGLARSDLMEVIKRNMALYRVKYMGKNTEEGEDMQKLLDKIISIKYELSRITPGESVGLLAAQSIGEPSTQMTLNTFHNAGQSEMNVTLGIPRMREILMCGSEKINTPSMQVPILQESVANGNVDIVLKKFSKLRLKDVIKLPLKIRRGDSYEIKLSFKDKASYKTITTLNRREMIPLIEKTFFKSFAKILKKYTHTASVEITDAKDDEFDVILNEAMNDDVDIDGEPKEELDAYKKSDSDSDVSDVDSDRHEEDENDSCDAGDSVEEIIMPMDESAVAAPESRKISKVVEMCPGFFKAYQVHQASEPKWIKLTVNMKQHQIDLKSLLLSLLESTVISSVDGVDKALIIDKGTNFATEGYNHLELFKYDAVFDLDRFYSNNIVKMAKIYGIEAAISCIEKEVMTVFKSYSIDVSSRHLRLIADFLTHSGTVGAFNRHSMKNHPSPVQRASYETALTVLNEMMIHGNIDSIKSPSSNIMLGQPVSNIGTNAMEIIFNRKAI